EADGETQESAAVTLPAEPGCGPGRLALPRVTFQTPEKPGEESSHRKLGKLTIKYNRKDLQRWLDLEEWINTQLQELYQCRVSSWGEPAPRSSGEWDWRACVLGQKVACSALLEIFQHWLGTLEF
uniref:Protein phosphatase 1 regulatory inhibitor subunit 14D n=1 Tax=Aquila chrysaetos chrysaetos TaxID=223781 RepID=A0A663EES1_AQUCH